MEFAEQSRYSASLRPLRPRDEERVADRANECETRVGTVPPDSSSRRQSTSVIPTDEHRLGSSRAAWLNLGAAALRIVCRIYEAVVSINHPTAPFVGVIEKGPKISPIGTLAMLIEAPGDFDLVQQGRIWALAEALSTWPNVQEAVIGVTNLMLVFEQPPEDLGVLSASIVELWHRLPSRKADGKVIEIPVV
jgi:hypothetical protein